MTPEDRTRHWGIAWVVMALAIALHVTDEAVNGFLPVYNSLVMTLRQAFAWVLLPTFSFRAWLTGLIVGILLLLALSPLIFAGNRFLRPLSYALGVLMTLNALGHIGGSIYLGIPVAGVWSSPFLLFAAVTLLVTTDRARRSHGSVDRNN